MPGSDFSGFPSGGRLALISPKDETVLPGNVSIPGELAGLKNLSLAGNIVALGGSFTLITASLTTQNNGIVSTSLMVSGFIVGNTNNAQLCFSSAGNSTVYATLNGGNGVGTQNLLRLGGSASASPVAQTMMIGESSRSGTDSNVAGASGTIQPGLGTGTGTPAPLILNAPVTVASGTGAQTYSEGFRVQGVGTLPGLSFFGGAAAVKPTITGSRATAAAIASLLTELATLGLITDGSSA